MLAFVSPGVKSIGVYELPNAAVIQRVESVRESRDGSPGFCRGCYQVIHDDSLRLSLKSFRDGCRRCPDLFDSCITGNIRRADDLRRETFWQSRSE